MTLFLRFPISDHAVSYNNQMIACTRNARPKAEIGKDGGTHDELVSLIYCHPLRSISVIIAFW